MHSVEETLSLHSYQGSGILMGNIDADTAVVASFIMGIGEASKNRIFVEEGEDIAIQPVDTFGGTEAEIYLPVLGAKNYTLVGNGTHIGAVHEYIFYGDSFQSALKEHSFIHDEHFTPRITGIMDSFGMYIMNIIKRQHKDFAQRAFYEYEPQHGVGHILYSYMGDAADIKPFVGEPRAVAIPKGIDTLAKNIWDALDKDNRISVAVRGIELATGRFKNVIINRK